MKLRSSSSGCEIRPAKGEPAQAGSKPCADSRKWEERCVGMRTCGLWDCGPETYASRMPRELDFIEGNNNPCVKVFFFPGRGGDLYPAGCSTIARTKRTVQ